jgi:hypothetical protein
MLKIEVAINRSSKKNVHRWIQNKEVLMTEINQDINKDETPPIHGDSNYIYGPWGKDFKI